MKIYCPESWSRKPGIDYGADSISLSAILPRVGQFLHASFSPQEELPVGDCVPILWQPPFSALNGWSEQPSEIAQSVLVVANVVRNSLRNQYSHMYDLEIISCEQFLPKLLALRGTDGNWELEKVLDTRKTPPVVFLTWDEVIWCGVAEITGFKYIAATTSAEAHMELIVHEVDGEFFGLYCAHCDPGGTSYNLGRRKLTNQESLAIKQAMDKSVQLIDSYKQYLIM